MEQPVETFHEASRAEIMDKLPPPVFNWMNMMQLLGMEPVFYASDQTGNISHGMVTNRGKYFTFQVGLDEDGSIRMEPDQWEWTPNQIPDEPGSRDG